MSNIPDIPLVDKDSVANKFTGTGTQITDLGENISNIYILNNLLKNNPDFIRLPAAEIDASVCINSINVNENGNCLLSADALNIIYLLQRANGFFGGRGWATTHRKTNFMIFEFGISQLEKRLNKYNIREINEVINDVHRFLGIADSININISANRILHHGNGNKIEDWENKIYTDKIMLFMSRKQRDDIRELKNLLGCSEGLIGLICVLISLNSIFEHCDRENTRIDVQLNDNIIKCSQEIYSREQYYNSGIVFIIDQSFEEYRNDLIQHGRLLLRHLIFIKAKLELDMNKMKKGEVDGVNEKGVTNTKEKLDRVKLLIDKLTKLK